MPNFRPAGAIAAPPAVSAKLRLRNRGRMRRPNHLVENVSRFGDTAPAPVELAQSHGFLR